MSLTTHSLAVRFLSLGGRFMIDPAGIPIIGISAEAVLGRSLSDVQRARANRLVRSAGRLTTDRTAELSRLIQQHGLAQAGGWIVWRGR